MNLRERLAAALPGLVEEIKDTAPDYLPHPFPPEDEAVRYGEGFCRGAEAMGEALARVLANPKTTDEEHDDEGV